ncbi:xanthine dehydrogenase molybdopterin binding subunit [Komagataeibacter oboediens]|uniref:Xanthine dehydrogenase molybdopterin binding subunit n=1 Tax=Komagataeibacter oboediens TaxID=65958 RepID=A0ABS5SJ41_9PROT|nr:xanthine dehydrogenase molybdopterin binding subunit [Komagataeibacter oboediens]MBL7233015.1 xanthine dehydrogenase molybdopterin binding subunit [Komagataeibacter oboediens]MBT0673837.1 xanthine dehydrogenase molybdopterin binding subunit [Komagataeibacter oboediens]MBT0677440.1 xanthine dehydrogenase molybdopterin binding subunit [Komagataeibacter oboediens]
MADGNGFATTAPASGDGIVAGGASRSLRHESAAMHVQGSAAYIDDLPEPRGTLHLVPGLSARAHARIVSMDLDAVRQAEGVVGVYTAADIPGENQISPVGKGDEPLLASTEVSFYGQPLFVVAATTRMAARRAVRLARVEYEDLPAILNVAEARAAGSPMVWRPMEMKRGDVVAGLEHAPRRLSGRITVGGQEHFYLEGQIALARPGEEGEMHVTSSTQHPTETQHMVAHVLDRRANLVTVEVRRMGGGFGGKETQANACACLSALVADLTGRAAKMRLDRDDDMTMTGKRHDFVIDYDVGYTDEGHILAVDMVLAARCGWSADLSGPVIDRALFHADNAYFYPDVRLRSEPLRTNTQSNTAYRGFGGPQGIVAAERVIEEIAFATGLDPLEVRLRNAYGTHDRNVTPYNMVVEDSITADVLPELARRCHYVKRREACRAFNAGSPYLRRGIAITPVKFGISFTATHYNQAGALVHVYTDGSVQVNHGGTEMGQGLHTKMVQVVMRELGLGTDQVRITATTTGKVPNTSATAASSGADLNGMAVLDAVRRIKRRLVEFAAGHWNVAEDDVRFAPDGVHVGQKVIAFSHLTRQAYFARVSMSANGFYKTPKISWNGDTGQGRPFYYFAYGAACSEVVIDLLTGEMKIDRVDILHDAGQSLNPVLDIGQVEGGFVQGAGWLTCEELVWDKAGRLRTHAPSTYKIPACSDRPRVFNVELLENAPNREYSIFRSKAVGEPPFVHGVSVLQAVSDALASLDDYRTCPRLDAPATPEMILRVAERMRHGNPPAA